MSGGYTVAEIIIVVGIIGLLTTLIVARYRDFDSTTVLRNLAYEVALSVREAQVMTISSSNLGADGAFLNQGQNSYGIAFTQNSDTYTIFTDLDRDNLYDSPSELVKLITISTGAGITDITERRSNGTISSVADASVAFDRPHLDTTFETSSGSGSVVELIVTVTSDRGGSRTVHIARSGRISVE